MEDNKCLDSECDKRQKKKKTIVVVITLFVVVLIIGTSYALWQLTLKQSGTNTIMTGCLQLTITEDTDAITLNEAVPMSDVDGKKLEPFTFTIANTCNAETKYVVNLETVSEGDKVLNDEYIKANLVKETTEVFIDKLLPTHINEEKVISTASAAYMLDQGTLKDKEKVTYSLRLWIAEADDASDVDAMMDATFASKITLTATYVPAKNMNELYNIVESQAVLDNVSSEFVTASTGIDFGVAPSDTNGKGVYTIADTKDDEYPVHYFRGAVTNNNVKFARLCWKIVRTTETGGVKLIYNGVPNEAGGCTNTTGEVAQIGTSAFNASYDSADYVGYMYPESTNENSSVLKTAIDTWYQNNMTDYTNMLEDTIWCNDRSAANKERYYGAYGRNIDLSNPSIVCPNDNDKFSVSGENGNGKLTYPVALLTADEATFAGSGFYSYSDNNSYLSTNQDWWLLSPGSFVMPNGFDYVAFSFYTGGRGLSHGDGADGDVTKTIGVRPSISLVPGTTVGFGDGSESSPYEIIKKP